MEKNFRYRIQVVVMDKVTQTILLNKVVYDFFLFQMPSVIYRTRIPKQFSNYNPLLLTVYDHTIYNNEMAQPALKLHVDISDYVQKTGNISDMQGVYIPLNFSYTNTPLLENKKINVDLPPVKNLILLSNFQGMKRV